jgi:hypothetical protein
MVNGQEAAENGDHEDENMEVEDELGSVHDEAVHVNGTAGHTATYSRTAGQARGSAKSHGRTSIVTSDSEEDNQRIVDGAVDSKRKKQDQPHHNHDNHAAAAMLPELEDEFLATSPSGYEAPAEVGHHQRTGSLLVATPEWPAADISRSKCAANIALLTHAMGGLSAAGDSVQSAESALEMVALRDESAAR